MAKWGSLWFCKMARQKQMVSKMARQKQMVSKMSGNPSEMTFCQRHRYRPSIQSLLLTIEHCLFYEQNSKSGFSGDLFSKRRLHLAITRKDVAYWLLKVHLKQAFTYFKTNNFLSMKGKMLSMKGTTMDEEK
jgi:hypothetical protein